MQTLIAIVVVGALVGFMAFSALKRKNEVPGTEKDGINDRENK